MNKLILVTTVRSMHVLRKQITGSLSPTRFTLKIIFFMNLTKIPLKKYRYLNIYFYDRHSNLYLMKMFEFRTLINNNPK